MTKQYYEQHLVNVRELTSRHGIPQERSDDLRREVEALLTIPMWRGVRGQVKNLLKLAQSQWAKNYKSTFPVKIPETLPWMKISPRTKIVR